MSSRIPALLQAAAAGIDPARFFEVMARRQGDPFQIRLPGIGEVLVTGHPDGAKDIFTAPPAAFEPIGSNPVEPLLGPRSLILLRGERHRRERKVLLPPFHGDRMRAYGRIIQELTQAELRRRRVGIPFIAQELAQSITLQVILRAVFGIVEAERLATVHRAIAATLERYTMPLMTMPPLRRSLWGLTGWERFEAARAALRALLLDEIAERRRRGTRGLEDVLSLLLEARYEDGSGLGDEELHDELCTMLVAGHETAATGLAWAFYFTLRDPAIQGALRAELDPLGLEPSPEALVALPYLGALVHEALRVNPVVPIVWRRTVQPITLRGREIPPGSNVAVAIPLLHTSTGPWKEPRRFAPERFLGRTYSPYEYVPFGGGARRCLGAAFALYEMKVVLGTVFALGQLALQAGPAPRAVLRNITMGPHRPIRLALTAPLPG